MSEMREPEVVASSGGYYTMLESAPEVDPARRPMSAPVPGAMPATGIAPVSGSVAGYGVVPAPMMGSAPAKVRAPSGAEAWSLGLLALLVFVPGFNVLFAAVVMMVVCLWDKKGLREPARTNRRLAASWGLTLLLVELALVVIQIVVVSIANDVDESPSFIPWGAPIITALAMVGVHVLVCSVQAVRAYRGTTLRFGGLPFFR